MQQSTCVSDAKNTRQFLWDDNSKGLSSRGLEKKAQEAKTPHTLDLNVCFKCGQTSFKITLFEP